MATEFDLPAGLDLVSQVGAQIASSVGTGYALELRNNDGANGVPGTLLARVDVPAASITVGSFQDFVLPEPVTVDADGFYLVWYQQSTTTFLAQSTNSVPSRLNLELLGGTYATFRYNETNDLFLRVTAASTNLFADGFE